ncbi:zinc finger protein, putative [Bodo saltans]|uniref:Palmitoyltransferase n=1 Tax=Bodo saltans TaxID=75058 RepID=A0A0S4IR23_BODSA|nr:zinc finger protein, putative [Bodo saltans]|eukprot:CUF37803.1 zinc finger protein, putative [Bodo saltans]
MLNHSASTGRLSEGFVKEEGASLLKVSSALGESTTVCCNDDEKDQAASSVCCWRSFCCSCRCVWATDAISTVVCTTVIVVLCAGFQYSWWASAADIDGLQFWLPLDQAAPQDPSSTSMRTCFGDQTERVHRIWFPVVAVQLVLMFATLYLLWSTTLTNPGILPKLPLAATATAPSSDLTQVQYVNGVQVYRPYCGTCNIVRPVRASHCATCNNCVERFDHHCGMIGACIGRRNFHLFFAFLCTITLLCAWTATCSVVLASPTLHCSVVKFGFLIVVIFFSGVLMFQLSAMTAYFIPLVLRNITKREDIKIDRLYHQPPYPGAHPFDKGNPRRNCSAMLCEAYDAVEYV